MEKTDFMRLTPEAQFEIRKAAVRMTLSGKSQVEVATFFGIARRSLCTWLQDYAQKGVKGLHTQKRGRRHGEQRTLSLDQEKTVQKLIVDKCPEQLKLPFALWTRYAVQQLMKDRFGLKVPIRTVGEYLKRWGFTPQKPLKRAYEQRPEEVKKWLENEYPYIKQRAHEEKAEIFWGDETGLSSEDHRGRGYAPKGKTPIRYTTGTRFSISMISAIANQGQMRYMIYKGALRVPTFIAFLCRLTRDVKRKIFLVIDNLRVHHAKKVQEWLAKHKDLIELFYLPPYTPERNPDEYLNQSIKVSLKNQATPRDRVQMAKGLLAHMKSLQKRVADVKSLFNHQSVLYAAA